MCTKWHDTRETAKIKCQKGETNDSLSFVTDDIIHADVFSVSDRCESCHIWRTAFRHGSITAWSKMFRIAIGQILPWLINIPSMVQIKGLMGMVPGKALGT